MLTLVFDTETTGLYDRKKVPTDDSQPDLVQLGAMLVEGDRVHAQIDLLVVPEQPIHPKALETHGLSLELTQRCGVSRRAALSIFHMLMKQADRIVAHNLSFDEGLLRTAYHREKISADLFNSKTRFCTMLSTTDICKLPAKWGHKWPSLIEAYSLLVDPNGFDGAHSAIADVKACYEVLKAFENQVPVKWWDSDEGISKAVAAGLSISWIPSWGEAQEAQNGGD